MDLNKLLKDKDFQGALMSSLAPVVGKTLNTTLSGGLESDIGSGISNIGGAVGGAVGAVNPLLGGVITAGSATLGGITNKLFGSKLNKSNINLIENQNTALNTMSVDNSSIDSIANQWQSTNWGTDFNKSFIGKDGLFSNKASNKYKNLKREQAQSRENAYNLLTSAAEDAQFNQNLSLLQTSAAYGGPIHIKPSKKGTFTAAAKKHGKGVQEFARQVLANKEDYSPAMVKKANFARNAAKFKHADGGPLMSNGTEWDNGIIEVNAGGLHSTNPYGGVPMGIDNQGIPNLVEQGEVIFNDYVFSNRLNVPKAVRSKYKLHGNKDVTFADAVKQIAKESEERPNDPISKRGLEDSMLKLQQAQEIVRQNMNNKKDKKGRKYKGGGELLRYAPVVANSIGFAQNLFSKPDYTYPDTIQNASDDLLNFERVGHTPFGQYLTYKPLDTNYQTNQLLSQAGATRRAIMNSSSPSIWANLLAQDYNTQTALGSLAREAENYNFARAQAVAQQNNQLRQANAELGLKAAMTNQDAQLKAKITRLSGIMQAMNMRDAIDRARSQSMSSSLSGLADALGNIGIDTFWRNERDKYITSTGISLPTGEDYYLEEDQPPTKKKQARAVAKRERKITD